MTNQTKQDKPLEGITLLTKQQIWGDNPGKKGQLQVMKAYGTKTGMTDLAVLLGGAVSSSNNTTSDGGRSAFVWSASSYDDGSVRAVYYNGDRLCLYPDKQSCGARPALPSSVASSIGLSDSSSEALAKGEAIRGKPIKDTNGKVIWQDVILYGEYPQTIADENITRELKGLSEAQLKNMETGKTYHFDGESRDAYDKPFSAQEHAEYQHKGKKYIRVEAKPCDSASVLSNGKTPKKGEACWIEVQPIEWLRDPSGVMVARQALFAGVQFDWKKKYCGNFKETDMYKYLNTYFAKEIIPSRGVAVAEADAKPERADGWAARTMESSIMDLATGAKAILQNGSWVNTTNNQPNKGHVLG